jgi:hypothetical protein
VTLRSVDWSLVTDVSVQFSCPIFKVQTLYLAIETRVKQCAWPLKMGPIGCAETSVTKDQSTVRKVTEECRSHINYDGSLKSGVLISFKTSVWTIL